MNEVNTADEKVAAMPPRRRFQCITIDAESVVINGEDFDAMWQEIESLKRQVAAHDVGVDAERANAWGAVWNRLMEIDPEMHNRKNGGLESALHLINELAARKP